MTGLSFFDCLVISSQIDNAKINVIAYIIKRKMNEFSYRLKIIMGGLSVRKFAERLEMSPTTVQEYIKGRTPPADFVVRVCERFGVDSWWLLTGDGKEPVPSISPRAAALVGNFEAMSEEDKRAFEHLVFAVAQSGKKVKKKAG